MQYIIYQLYDHSFFSLKMYLESLNKLFLYVKFENRFFFNFVENIYWMIVYVL